MKLFLKFVLLCAFSLSEMSGKAQPVIILNPENTQKYIGLQVSILQDTLGLLNIDAVIKNPDLFKASQLKVPNLGITPFNNWIRFKIRNTKTARNIILNVANPAIEELTLYVVYPDNRVDSSSISESTSIRNRLFDHQFFIYNISLRSDEEVICYLKLKSNKQILAPISLETEKSILKKISDNDTLAGMYFGIMLVMLLYNLFIYFSVRDTSYLVYVNYIFWVALTQAALLGYSNRLFWVENAWLSNNMVTLCGALVGIATVSFAKSFLKTSVYAPKFNPYLNIVIWGDILAIVLIFAGFPIISYTIVNGTAALGSVLILLAGLKVFAQNYRPAKFFLIAWIIFLISVFLYVMKDYGIFPYNFLTVHSLQLGSAIEVFLLSIALADRINILKKEKETSQAQALESATENARIIREQNVVLEAKVNERTFELNVVNTELNKTLIDLKEAEAHLVESEKMASLGQLTAGIAHEINNPINFVTSNINPLKRDIDMLWDALNQTEKIAYQELSKEEKLRQINEYKEEIDIDYLKLEINQLLKGIQEGASRTTEIVKGLRIFSRLDEDELKKANLNECLDSTLIIVNNLFSDKISLIKMYGDIPLIECYPGKLNQVFLNIISNAIFAVKKKFEERTGGKINITTMHNPEHILVKIEDNGIGMEERIRKKIFEPFFTTKDVGEGTGLGMSIVHNTIRKHNGEITVSSTPGEGSEFIIKLPLTPTRND